MTKKIPLTQGFVALISDCDAELISPYRWCGTMRGRKRITRYAITNVVVNGKPTMLYMHRLILDPPPKVGVDHINHDGLDNRRCNLRLATQTQNNGNARVHADSKSGVKGVYRQPRTGRWIAQIRTPGKSSQYIGSYATKEEAAQAYADAARQIFGEFAYVSA